MNISYKTIQLFFILALANFASCLALLIQFQPESPTVKYAIIAGLISSTSLVLLVWFMNIQNAAFRTQPRLKPRFGTRFKEQLWGIWIRLISGVGGFGFVMILFDLPLSGLLAASLFYLCIMVAGFFFDGRRFDDHQHRAELRAIQQKYPSKFEES